jgi:hypothetical protein
VWMDFDVTQTNDYATMLRQGRITVAKQGLYSKKGLGIMKKIRCSMAPQEAECSSTEEYQW